MHASAPGQHTAGHRAEPQQGEDVDPLIAKADDQHGGQRNRLLDLLPLVPEHERLGQRGAEDEDEGDERQRRVGGQGWVGEDERDPAHAHC